MNAPTAITMATEPINYKKNIQMYIQQERLRVTCQAINIGIKEEDVDKLLIEENVSDLYLENIKIRLGIIEKKP